MWRKDADWPPGCPIVLDSRWWYMTKVRNKGQVNPPVWKANILGNCVREKHQPDVLMKGVAFATSMPLFISNLRGQTSNKHGEIRP